MRTARLGARGPEVSVVAYGAWEIGGDAYGPNASPQAAVRAVRAALDAGITLVDTAEVYGCGLSERLVGRALRGRREEVVLATKVAPRPAGSGLRPSEIARAVRGSLRRLRTDRIDLYQLHWFPPREVVPIEETWGAMQELVREGLVRWVGVSNFTREQVRRCLAIAPVDSVQPELSMLVRDEEALCAWCGRRGIGVLAYGPLAYGLLTGAISRETRFHPEDFRSGSDPTHEYYRRLFEPRRLRENLARVARLRPVAERLGVSLAQLALAWVLHRPGVTAAIAGSRDPAHVREDAAAGDVLLPRWAMREVEAALSPPGATG